MRKNLFMPFSFPAPHSQRVLSKFKFYGFCSRVRLERLKVAAVAFRKPCLVLLLVADVTMTGGDTGTPVLKLTAMC